MIRVVAFDADDTLWHNEHLFIETREKFKALLAPYHSPEWIVERLDDTELGNLRHFGYGIKGFALSMIETAIDLTEGRIAAGELQPIVDFAKDMSAAPVRLIEGAEEVVRDLAGDYRLMIVTKGDLFDQESKVARSGLGHFMHAIEIVSDKTPATYMAVIQRADVAPEEFLMVGNSLRSDILPVVEVGAQALFVPYETTWSHESISGDELEGVTFHRAPTLVDVPATIRELSPPN